MAFGYYATINVNLYGGSSSGNGKTTPKETTPSISPQKSDRTLLSRIGNGTKIKGLAFATANLLNSAVGSYTGNRVRQSNIQAGISLASLGIVAISNPISAGVVASSYAIKRGVDIHIDQLNAKEQANYNRSYLGNMTTNGSRWKGGL